MVDRFDPLTRAGSRSRRASVGAILALAFTLAIAFASSAQAYVYWTNAHSIGRADQDGTNVNQNFISNQRDEFVPEGVAVDSQHVYWTTFVNGKVGRANLDGTNVDRDFITGADRPNSVTTDAAGPGGGGPGRQIVGSVDPHRATLDDRTCFRFHARDESGKRLRNVKVRFGGKHHRTDRRGRTKICKTFAKPGARHAHLTKGAFAPDKLRVKVRG